MRDKKIRQHLRHMRRLMAVFMAVVIVFGAFQMPTQNMAYAGFGPQPTMDHSAMAAGDMAKSPCCDDCDGHGQKNPCDMSALCMAKCGKLPITNAESTAFLAYFTVGYISPPVSAPPSHAPSPLQRPPRVA